jgi:hypothetical protein
MDAGEEKAQRKEAKEADGTIREEAEKAAGRVESQLV